MCRPLRAWAGNNIIIPDGPRKGQRFRILREPWREIAKAVTSPRLEQMTIRASVSSPGKPRC